MIPGEPDWEGTEGTTSIAVTGLGSGGKEGMGRCMEIGAEADGSIGC